MAETEKKDSGKKTPPRKKGGTRYPRINLEQAVGYAKKLVAKTHTGPLPATTILPGVFGNSGPTGEIRAAALKQFGLLEGKSSAYKATQLAKDIDAALAEERSPLLQRSLLTSKVFGEIFETFKGDTVSKAKIEQRAKGVNVHTESASECAQIFIESALTAKLGTTDGDNITLITAGEVPSAASPATKGTDEGTENNGQEEAETGSTTPPQPPTESGNGDQSPAENTPPPKPRTEKPAVTLALTVDATSDPDKLEKQLKLLRQFGVI